MNKDFNEKEWYESLGKVKAENNKTITHTLVAIPMTLELEVPIEVCKDEDSLRQLAEEIIDTAIDCSVARNDKIVNYYCNVILDVDKKIRYKFYDKTTKGV